MAASTAAAVGGWATGLLPFGTASGSAAAPTLPHPPHVLVPSGPRPGLSVLCRRAAWLLWCFLPALAWALTMLSWGVAESRLFEALRNAVVRSRSAALIKWAQWAAVRPDLFPVGLCDLLAELHAGAPVHALPSSAGDLAVLNVPLEKMQDEPVASGSIAQVHLAELHGRRVAVKVRHPGVEQTLLADFELLRALAGIADLLPGLAWLNAPAMVQQFEMAMEGQCDLREEAASLEAFRINFRRKPWMVFPAVEAASEAVLVESFEDGEHVSQFIKRLQSRCDPTATEADAHFLVTQGQDCYLQMLLVDNLMHADLHPGNIMIRGSSEEHSFPGPREMILVDAGMSKELTDDERRNFIGLFQALGDGDGRAVARNLLHFSHRQRCPDPAAFEAAIDSLCAAQCGGYGRNVQLGPVLRAALETVRRHQVSIDGNYATLVVNVLCIEAMARSLEPRYNVLDAAYPLLRAHQLLGDELFRRLFSAVQHGTPPCVFTMVHRVMLYSGMNGESLRRFQI